MIIEQIRYWTSGDIEPLVDARRRLSRVRREQGLPGGHILLADETPSDSPILVWQCGYGDEGEMGMVETRLIGNSEYEEARAELGELSERVEVELYLTDPESEE